MEQFDANGQLKWDYAAQEHYVPLHTTDLVEFLAQHPILQPERAGVFRKIATLILTMEHHLYRQRHEQLLYAYAPLDPDLDRILASVPTQTQRRSLIDETRDRVRCVLQRANYRQFDQEDINKTLAAASAWGVRMRINFELQEWMDVYTRGHVIVTRRQRSWRKFYRYETYEVPLYQRLVVVFSARENHPQKFDTQRVYLRMFKNVPRQDIDMMLPGAGVHMTWVDHSKIVLPSIFSAGMTMWRIMKYFFMLALLGVFKSVGIVLIAVLAIAYGFRSLLTFRLHTQRRYLLNMTQSLYYQSLGNNIGVLLRLLEEGEQQESCEAILAYFVALKAGSRPIALEDFNRECRELIHQAAGVDTEFHVESTINHLVQLGLIIYQEKGWVALPPNEALERLEHVWDEWFKV